MHEISTSNKLNFLDVNIEIADDTFHTSVYSKPTNPGIYINTSSEYPERYKNGTIKALIHRTYKISSDWQLFNHSIDTLKQTLINNGYSNKLFDRILNTYLNDKLNNKQAITCDTGRTHTVFYKNQFSLAYKTDEWILQEIMKNNIHCNNSNDTFKLTIYYPSHTTTSLVLAK